MNPITVVIYLLLLLIVAAPVTFTGVRIYFVDKETNENSFVSGALTLDDIIVTDSDNSIVETELQVIELDDPDLSFRSHSLVIYDDFKVGPNQYSFRVKDKPEFEISYETIEYTTGCCLGIYLDDVQIEGIDHNQEHSIYLPIIYID